MSSHQLIMNNWRLFLEQNDHPKKKIISERGRRPYNEFGDYDDAITLGDVEVYGCSTDAECPPGMVCGKNVDGEPTTCVPGSRVPGMNDFAWTQVFLAQVMDESQGYQNFAQKWNDISNEIMLGILPHMPRNASFSELGQTVLELALFFVGWNIVKAGGKGMLAMGKKLLDKVPGGNMLKEIGKKAWTLMNSTQVSRSVINFVKSVVTNKVVHKVLISLVLGAMGGKIAHNFVTKYSEVMNRKVLSGAEIDMLDSAAAFEEAEQFILDNHDSLMRCDDGMVIDTDIEGAACSDGSVPSRQSSGGGDTPLKPSYIPPNMMVCDTPKKYKDSAFQFYLIDKFNHPDGCPEDPTKQEMLFLGWVYKTYGPDVFRASLGDAVLKYYEAASQVKEVITKYRKSKNIHPVANKQWWFDA